MPRRSKTPGVRLVSRKRRDGVTWYGRWQDQLTGKWHDENLTAAGLTTDNLRRRWLQRKADELQAARRAFALGVAHTSLEDAKRRYLDDCKGRRLRFRSVRSYGTAVDRLVAFLHEQGRAAMQEVTPADLWAFRSRLIQEEKKASTVNSLFARTRAALNWWRRAQLLPLLNSDLIADAFMGVPKDAEEIRPLSPGDIRTLLGAAVSDPEPESCALIALVLLTGMRRGEVEAIGWDDVQDLDGDHPAIKLGTWVKTRRPRTVDLSVSPAAAEILRALGELHGRDGYVLSGETQATEAQARDRRERLQVLATRWTYRRLRQTCGTYLANAPGIWGGASAYRSARQLGHSVAIAERHYLGVIPGIPATALTVEAAMQAVDEMAAVAGRLRKARTGSEVDRVNTCGTSDDVSVARSITGAARERRADDARRA